MLRSSLEYRRLLLKSNDISYHSFGENLISISELEFLVHRHQQLRLDLRKTKICSYSRDFMIDDNGGPKLLFPINFLPHMNEDIAVRIESLTDITQIVGVNSLTFLRKDGRIGECIPNPKVEIEKQGRSWDVPFPLFGDIIEISEDCCYTYFCAGMGRFIVVNL